MQVWPVLSVAAMDHFQSAPWLNVDHLISDNWSEHVFSLLCQGDQRWWRKTQREDVKPGQPINQVNLNPDYNIAQLKLYFIQIIMHVWHKADSNGDDAVTIIWRMQCVMCTCKWWCIQLFWCSKHEMLHNSFHFNIVMSKLTGPFSSHHFISLVF